MPTVLSMPQRHLAWQHWLLSQMQITTWVKQNQSIKSYQFADIFVETNDNFSIQPTLSYHTETPIINNKNLENLEFDQIFYTDMDDFPKPAEQSSTKSQATVLQTVEPFTLQGMIANHWLLIVDTRILQQDAENQQLWVNIANAFHQQPQTLHFPLVTNFDKLDKNLQNQMNHYHLAIASFQGFIAQLKQQQTHQLSIKSEQIQLGCLTDLPVCLQSQPIKSLPTLSAMLQDSTQKQLLWQTLTQSHA